MRLSNLLLIILVSIQFAYAKDDEYVELLWKHTTPIAYEINFKDNPHKQEAEKGPFSEYTMVSIIKPKSDEYSIKFIMDKIGGIGTQVRADNINLMGLLGTVQIRADVNNRGEMLSFWLDKKQANVITLMFQLPPKPVKVGDSWSVDTNLILLDGNFICSSQYKNNSITLVEIKKVSGKRQAVLEYNITEKVQGKFLLANIECEMTYTGTALFLIDEGRFENQNLTLSVNAKGMQIDNLIQTIDIKFLPKVPEQYLLLE